MIQTLGVASNLGYRRGHSHRAVPALMQSKCSAALAKARIGLHWQLINTTQKSIDAEFVEAGAVVDTLTHTGLDTGDDKPELQLAHINRLLADGVRRSIGRKRRFLVLGGDHSIAMGTWSGAIKACREAGTNDDKSKLKAFGLLWIDAHMDAHNYRSSPSKNIHGMPLRALLDQRDPRLKRLCPESGRLCGKHLQLLGIRSYELPEQIFMESQQATITYMRDLPAGDCGPALLQALGTLSRRCRMIGISIDLDAIDPIGAPGVATREAGGIQLQSLCRALKRARGFDKIVGLEICEYDPAADTRQRTSKAVLQLISAFYGELSVPYGPA
ncbi:MAG: arginase family protein [Gammaproteobacteria bacterium]|nr:arginase family protein [Gammaproteobacteria bacterium]MBQ0840281.1 arginase family protein [Gammaproteobacteria bacterium]